jgi:hypothetical protein
LQVLSLERAVAQLPAKSLSDVLNTLTEAREREKQRVESDQRELETKTSELERFSGFSPPRYWKTKQLPATPAEFSGWKPYRLITEDPPVVKELQGLVDRTCITRWLGTGSDQKDKGRYTRLRVHSVKRVENLLLWSRYKAMQFTLQATREMLGVQSAEKQLQTKLNSVPHHQLHKIQKRAELRTQLNEVYLFHGTSEATSKNIFSGGFNERFARDGWCKLHSNLR